jgi:iron complex outermembrane receptor protein
LPSGAGKRRLFTVVAVTALWPSLVAAQAPAVDADAQRIEEVVVTAQRREERIQDVPAAISAISGSQLEALGVSSTLQLTQVAPSLNFVVAGTAPQPTIRGIGARGTNAGDESIVPIYIDGVYQPFAPGLVFETADVARVEVLRGPQGTLYGRNATGGAINIVTKTPSVDPSGYATISYGRFDEWEFKSYATAGTDAVQGSLAVAASTDDGYQRDVGPRGGRLARQESFVIRPKVRFEPSASSEVVATINYSKSFSNTGLVYRPINGNTAARRTTPGVLIPAPYSLEATTSFEPSYKVNQIAGSVIGKMRFDRFDVTAITGVQRNSSKLTSDSDGTQVNNAFNFNHIVDKSFNQEVYATSSGEGPFRWTGGVFYFHDRATYRGGTTFANNFNSAVVTDSFAGYLEGAYEIVDDLVITLGGRYTHERKKFDAQQIVVASGAVTRIDNSKSWSKFTPSGSVRWSPSPDFNLYAKAGQAFKSGVYNTQGITRSEPVDQELVTSYEVGAKADPTPWLRTNVAVFYTDYKNMQATARDPVTGTVFLQNAAGAELWGAEADLYVKPPIRGLNLRFGVAAVHGEFTEFAGAQANVPAAATTCALVNGVRVFPCGNVAVVQNLAGFKLPKVPDVAISMGGDYTIPVGDDELTLAANIYRAGRSYWYADNRLKQSPYVLVNASATYTFGRDGRYRVTVWGENLTGEEYQLSLLSTGTGDLAIDNKPPSYGVRFGVNW